METKEYFEKVMQDFNQHRNGPFLAMLNFKSNITYYLSSTPTDMRKGREGLAGVVREILERNPHNYNEAFHQLQISYFFKKSC